MKITRDCKICGKTFTRYIYDEIRGKFCSRRCFTLDRVGRKTPHSQETKDKIGNAMRGKTFPERSGSNSHLWKGGIKDCVCGNKKHRYAKNCKKCAMKKNVLRGCKHPWWRGGVTSRIRRLRASAEYKEWRIEVFKRDDYTCQECGNRDGKINADHIKSFTFYPKLRFELNNGRTLCIPCHRKTDNYGFKAIRPKLS